MRLSIRLSIILGAVITGVLAVDGAWRLSGAVDDVESDFSGRMSRQGRLLAAAAAETWTRQGELAAQRFVAEVAPDLSSSTEGRWLPVGPMPAEFQGDRVEWSALLDGARIKPRQIGDRYVGYLSIPRPEDQKVGAVLELSRSRTSANSATWRVVRKHLLLLVIELAALLLAVYVAVRSLVAAPLTQLTELARRLGDSDFSARVLTRRDDEVGRLARQMNAAAEQLQAARDAAERASKDKVRAMDELRHAERLKTVGLLGSGIAHELGTPLNVVIGRAKMIKKGYVEGDDLIESAQVIMDQGQRMAELIRNLLTFARRKPAAAAEVDLSELVRDTEALLQPLLIKRDTQLTATLDDSAVVTGDASALQQVVTNLIMNGADAGARSVDVVVTSADKTVVITVTDDGSGMSPEVLARIFDPFFTTKSVAEGTGLGLSITYGIVQDHRGKVTVESAEGEGTAFTIVLPKEATLSSEEE